MPGSRQLSSIIQSHAMCSCSIVWLSNKLSEINTSRRYLCSATHGNLLVPRTRTMTYGPRSVAVSGPTVWNTLPSTLRVSATTLGEFSNGLKTILFRLAYGT